MATGGYGFADRARSGFHASIGRVHRLYQQEGLKVRRQKRKRLKGIAPANPLISRPNQEWALDFVSDAFSNGRALKALTMVDCYARECLVHYHRIGRLQQIKNASARAISAQLQQNTASLVWPRSCLYLSRKRGAQ